MKFRKDPVEFEAIQFDGHNLVELQDFCGVRADGDGYQHEVFNLIGTYLPGHGFERDGEKPEAELWVDDKSILPIYIGEWIVKDDLGFYPCKDDILRKNNTPIED